MPRLAEAQVVVGPEAQLVGLVVVQAAERVVTRLVEDLGVVAEVRRGAGGVGPLALVVAVVAQLVGPVALHGPGVGQAVAGLQLHGAVLAHEVVGVGVERAVEGAQVDAVHADVGLAGALVDEVLEEAGDGPVAVDGLDVAAPGQGHAGREGPLARGRRGQVGGEGLGGRREAAAQDLGVVGGVEARGAAAAHAGRAGVEQVQVGRVADRRVVGELGLGELAGVLGVGGVEPELAVALGVPAQGQARHEVVGVGADDAAGGVAAHALVAHSQVGRPVAVDLPLVVQEEGLGGDVDAGARGRVPADGQIAAGLEDRLEAALGVERRPADRALADVVGVERVVGLGLGVAAGVGGAVVLVAGLDVVAPEAGGRQEVRQAAGDLAVVAVLGVLGREVGGVVVVGAVVREDRRVHEGRALPAGVLELELLLRVLRLGEQARADHAVVVGREQALGRGARRDVEGGRVGREARQAGPELLDLGVDVAGLHGVVLGQRAGQLRLVAVVRLLLGVGDGRELQQLADLQVLAAGRAEEPQAVLQDRAAQRGRVGLVGGLLLTGAVHRPVHRHAGGRVLSGGLAALQRVLVAPGGVGVVDPEAAAEGVAAAFGDGVDHAAAEAPVLGRDAGGQHLHLLEGVLDEQAVGRAEEVVVHVDPVDQEDVVEGERARDGDLVGVGGVVAQARRELRDRGQGAAGGQLVHGLVAVVGAHGALLEGRGGLGRDRHRLLHGRHRQAGVGLGRGAQRHGQRLPDGRQAGQLERDRVGARRQGLEDVAAVGVAHRGAQALQRRRLGRDRDARQRLAVRRLHLAAENAGLRALRERGARDPQGQGREGVPRHQSLEHRLSLLVRGDSTRPALPRRGARRDRATYKKRAIQRVEETSKALHAWARSRAAGRGGVVWPRAAGHWRPVAVFRPRHASLGPAPNRTSGHRVAWPRLRGAEGGARRAAPGGWIESTRPHDRLDRPPARARAALCFRWP